jgi:hypothetical protein
MRNPHGGRLVVIAGMCLVSDIAFIGLPSMPYCLGSSITSHVLDRFALALPRPGVLERARVVIEVTIDRQP